jgi:paraquat-inducible protein B
MTSEPPTEPAGAPAAAPAPAPADVWPRRRRLSMVWLIPIVAALIAAWLAYKTISERGPTIQITFQTAEGLEAGKSKIRFKDVEIGSVDAIHISDDLSHVIVSAEMANETAEHLNAETRFWVVRPRLTASGVSGLGTLVSGAYIEMDPGGGEQTRAFEGLEQPPVVRANVPGTEYLLRSSKLGSLTAGTPIYYRGVPVGEVLGYELADGRQQINIPIFVRAPHDRLVRDGSRFWNASGIDVEVGAEGVRVDTESIQALLSGGIAFDTPATALAAEQSAKGRAFTLYDSYARLDEAQYALKVPYLVYFDASVRGLSPGSPVEFRGIKLGAVTDVRLQFNPETLAARIPVTIEIEPERVSLQEAATDDGAELDALASYRRLAQLVDRGLRAQLQPGNLLTGQLVVALDFHPEAPPADLDRTGIYPAIPTVPSDIEQIARSASSVLEKVASLPIEDLLTELTQTAQSVNALLNAPSVQRAVDALDEVAPLLQNATQTLANAEATLGSAGDFVGSDSRFRRDLLDLMRELKDAARSLRVLSDYLERHPEALLRGKSGDVR